jgi:hypothetical protein
LVDEDAAAAAVRAGYKARSAPVLMGNAAIRDAIRSRQDAEIAATGVNGEHAELLRLANEVYTTAASSNNASGMVAALKLRADLNGVMKASASEITGDLNDLTDAELKELLYRQCRCYRDGNIQVTHEELKAEIVQLRRAFRQVMAAKDLNECREIVRAELGDEMVEP